MFVQAPFMSWNSITFLFLLLLSSISIAGNNRNKSKGEVVIAISGVVATNDSRCSRIGRNVLRDGGNAVDASVAAALCLGVVSPASSGLGGGGFILVRLASGKKQVFDMRETAPIRASQEMYVKDPAKKESGPLSIAVPGELAGLRKAWKQYGKLPWKRLVSPAENLARNGFNISRYLHVQMVSAEACIKADSRLRNIYAPLGNLLPVGHIIRNTKLADTLEEISKNGSSAFYSDLIGRNMVVDIQKVVGILSMGDLKRYKATPRTPISANISGLNVLGVPPPAAGSTALVLALNILALYGFPSGVSGPLGYHRQLEAVKHTLAMKMNLGDSYFVKNVKYIQSSMLSPSFAAKLKNTINDNQTFGPPHYGSK